MFATANKKDGGGDKSLKPTVKTSAAPKVKDPSNRRYGGGGGCIKKKKLELSQPHYHISSDLRIGCKKLNH